MIIKLISEKKYFRANFYIIEVLAKILKNTQEYILYLEFICSENEIEHNQAISQLLFLSKNKLKKLSDISNEYDFSIFFNIPERVDKLWLANLTKNTSLNYRKIVLIAAYRKIPCKKIIAGLSDDPNLFDFVFFLPDISSRIIGSNVAV